MVQFHYHTGLVARKPVFGVSDKMRYKPACSATETCQKIENADAQAGLHAFVVCKTKKTFSGIEAYMDS